MDKKEIIFLTAILLFAAIRLYQKYFRKPGNTANKGLKAGKDSFSSTKADDYEPYSGR